MLFIGICDLLCSLLISEIQVSRLVSESVVKLQPIITLDSRVISPSTEEVQASNSGCYLGRYLISKKCYLGEKNLEIWSLVGG